jgi:3-oxoadipyl-CoA thiolase
MGMEGTGIVGETTVRPEPQDACVVVAVRTPIGRHRGGLAGVRPDDLAALVIREVVRRAGVEPTAVEDVQWGAANQAGEDNRNVARMAALLAGLPVETAGSTVNRLCGSSLEAVANVFHAVRAGEGDVLIAGGSESMSRAPWVMMKPDRAFPAGNREVFDTTLGWRMTNPRLAALHYPYSMGETAENLAERYAIGRADQDAFALESHRRAVRAAEAGWFADELVAVETPTGVVARDEGPRPDTSLEKLARLAPAFRPGGTVTAGNASSINDGAAALLIMSGREVLRRGLTPLARLVSTAVAGVDPAVMGIGPVPATAKALERAGWTLADVDLVELNEAFAAQSLAVLRELPIARERLNVHGGAIALGHPLGASGARILTTLLHAMRRHGVRRGLATMCLGVGQGIAVLVERLG